MDVLLRLHCTSCICVDEFGYGHYCRECRDQSKEKAKLAELKELELLFLMMDADGNGTLSWEEFKAAFDDPNMAKKWKLLDFEPDECREVFQLLDDGDGEIETQEFFDGLRQMKGMAQSKDVFRLVKKVDMLSR